MCGFKNPPFSFDAARVPLGHVEDITHGASYLAVSLCTNNDQTEVLLS